MARSFTSAQSGSRNSSDFLTSRLARRLLMNDSSGRGPHMAAVGLPVFLPAAPERTRGSRTSRRMNRIPRGEVDAQRLGGSGSSVISAAVSADLVTIDVALDLPGEAGGIYKLVGQSAFLQFRTARSTSGGLVDGVPARLGRHVDHRGLSHLHRGRTRPGHEHHLRLHGVSQHPRQHHVECQHDRSDRRAADSARGRNPRSARVHRRVGGDESFKVGTISMTVVPEPGTLALVLLPMLAMLRRRRRTTA